MATKPEHKTTKAIVKFLDEVAKIHRTGNATEHSYRGTIGTLIDSLDKDVASINEPKRIECGAPDFSVSKKTVPVGYIEAKNIGIDLKDKKEPNAGRRKIRKFYAANATSRPSMWIMTW